MKDSIVMGLATYCLIAGLGCGPTISAFDVASPPGVNRLSYIEAHGENLILAGVQFDGVMVGSWVVLPPPGVTNARRTVVPLNQGGAATEDSVEACNAIGCGARTLMITGPGSLTPGNIDVVFPGVEAANCYFFTQQAVCVTVAGTGIYPGRATLTNPDAGPAAETDPGGHSALGTKMLSDNAVLVFFPRSLSNGSSRIKLTNDTVYESPPSSSTTTNPFVQN